MRGFRFLSLLAVCAAIACALPVGAAARAVPKSFVGMMADGPLFVPGVKLGPQIAKMAATGVGSIRVAFVWSQAQPYAHWSDVPQGHRKHFVKGPHGVPTTFFETDRVVALAAKDDLSVLPVVTLAPSWDGSKKGNHVQPAHDAGYARYLTALVNRYGPHGSFWTDNPKLPRRPITSWQIWNEPELTDNWNTFPFAKSYVKLLKAGSQAVRQADHSAKVVLASLTNFGWKDLASIYKIKGSRGLFDEVAANPYTKDPSGVITILGYFRNVMDKHGDSHKPLLATEIGWPSGLHQTNQNFGFNTTEKGQANKTAQILPLLAQNRRRLGLAGFYYYTWISTDPKSNGTPFDYAGLFRFNTKTDRIKAKPAYAAFRQAAQKIEGH